MSNLPHFLFVDDSPAVLDGLRRQLRAFQSVWRLHFATSVAEAIQYLNSEKIDVVITDIDMPKVDGQVLMNLIHSLPHGPSVVVLSGAACENDLRSTTLCPFEFLEKPCTTPALVAAIAKAARRKHDKNTTLNEEVLAILVRKLKLYGMITDCDLPNGYNAQLSLQAIAALLTDGFNMSERSH